MEKEEKEKLVVQRIISALIFMPICMLSVLTLRIFISGYLALIISGGALGVFIIWVAIRVNQKYRFCNLKIPSNPIEDRIGWLIFGTFILLTHSDIYRPNDFRSIIIIAIALGTLCMSIFSKTRKGYARGFWTAKWKVICLLLLACVIAVGFRFNWF